MRFAFGDMGLVPQPHGVAPFGYSWVFCDKFSDLPDGYASTLRRSRLVTSRRSSTDTVLVRIVDDSV